MLRGKHTKSTWLFEMGARKEEGNLSYDLAIIDVLL